MKYVVNWIPLRIRVRSTNTQPHLKLNSNRAARPYESCQIFKDGPAEMKRLHRQYKSFPIDRLCHMEIKNTNGLINKPSTA